MKSTRQTLIEWHNTDEESLLKLLDLCRRTFSQTYAHLNDASNFQKYLDQSFNVRRLRDEVLNPESFFYVVPKNNQLIAYLKLNIGMAQTEEKGEDWVEIERIYVDRGHHGKGLGKLLIRSAEKFALEQGKKGIWLGVWDRNTSAIAFYNQMKFEVAGTHIFQLGDDAQTDFIMQKVL